MRAAAILLFVAVTASADPCNTDGAGLDVLKADGGEGYIFYSYGKPRDYSFVFSGGNIEFPEGIKSKSIIFKLDGVNYEALRVNSADITKGEVCKTARDVLKVHQKYQVKYAKESGAPWTKVATYDPISVRGAYDGAEHEFLLWSMFNPALKNEPRQFYISTLVGGEIFVVSAQTEGDASARQALSSLNDYALSFNVVVSPDQCPRP